MAGAEEQRTALGLELAELLAACHPGFMDGCAAAGPLLRRFLNFFESRGAAACLASNR
jgi:hypothetical protein